MDNHERKEDRKGERGSVLAMTALSMFALLVLAGLAVEISSSYPAQAELQNAADVSARAAVSQLNSTAGGIKSAANEATKALDKYDFKKVTVTGSEVTFAANLNGTYVDMATAIANPTSIRFARVTLLPEPRDAALSALLSFGIRNISATATTGLSAGLTMDKASLLYK